MKHTDPRSDSQGMISRINTMVVHGHKPRYRPFLAASIAALLAIVVGVLPVHAQNDNENDPDREYRQNSNPDNDGDNRQDIKSCPSKLQVFGLTDDGRLVRFGSNSPQNTRNIGTINGLQHPDTALIGIDFRVQDGLLYGVGNGGGVYKISTSTAQATLVNRLTISLQGTSFGVDFNPAADRLRIVSDVGQNLRHNVNSGGVTVADGPLTYTPPPADPVSAIGVTASAYTNNDLNPNTATTLFAIDTNLDQVAIQSPANNGILVATGKLGIDVDLPAGFDIYSRLNNGLTVENCAFATLTTGTPSFYRINLLTGAATRVGGYDAFVVDIALPLDKR